MRRSGRVKFFDEQKGYGFLHQDGGAGEIFFHRVDLQESCRVDGELRLCPDDLVEFEVVDTGRGPRVVDVSTREGRHAPAS